MKNYNFKNIEGNGIINNEIHLMIAHHTLVNSSGVIPKISIYGLGSCVALILYDNENKIFSMSHILLPTNKNPNLEGSSKNPHKFADQSVRALIKEMQNHGAKIEKIKAIVVGGSQIFDNPINNLGTENVNTVKKELEAFKVKIEKEDCGGTKGRNVILDTRDKAIYLKTTLEEDYRKIILK